MVAISMYRGNLHRVPDVPRRWLMPTQKLSIKDFKSLLHRRKRALSRLRPSASNYNPNPNPYPNPNPNPNPNPYPNPQTAKSVEVPAFSAEPKLLDVKIEDIGEDPVREDGNKPDDRGGGDGRRFDGVDCSGKPTEVQQKKEADDAVGGDGNPQVAGKPADAANEKTETYKTNDSQNERDKRKREVEEKLQVLNAKKHNLVQVLKHILNAEEELKRRNSSQQGITATRPSVRLQVDVSNDSGANLGGHVEGGETEDASNHNVQSRHFLRMSSASPSSESPLRRPAFMQHNMVPHSSRASPRFVPTGHQTQQGNPPTVSVSVSGTNYIASSPSPAASGGTSVFRDSRLPSPLN